MDHHRVAGLDRSAGAHFHVLDSRLEIDHSFGLGVCGSAGDRRFPHLEPVELGADVGHLGGHAEQDARGAFPFDIHRSQDALTVDEQLHAPTNPADADSVEDILADAGRRVPDWAEPGGVGMLLDGPEAWLEEDLALGCQPDLKAVCVTGPIDLEQDRASALRPVAEDPAEGFAVKVIVLSADEP